MDNELLNCGRSVLALLKDYGISHVSVVEPRSIHDRSWEMSAALCAMRGKTCFATGTVEHYDRGEVAFGPIGGLSQKVKNYKGLMLETYDNTHYSPGAA